MEQTMIDLETERLKMLTDAHEHRQREEIAEKHPEDEVMIKQSAGGDHS
jgi:hypothetical protein